MAQQNSNNNNNNAPAPVVASPGLLLPSLVVGGVVAAASLVQTVLTLGAPAKILLALALAWLLSKVARSVLVVRTGNRVVVERWGTFSRVLGPGVHLLTPFCEVQRRVRWSRQAEDAQGRVRTQVKRDAHIPVNETAFDLPPVVVTTKDRCEATVNAVLVFKITNVEKAVYLVDDMWNAVGLLMATSLRKAVSALTFEEARARADDVRAAVWADFEARAERWGLEICELDLQSVTASAGMAQATERLVQAQRESQARVELASAEAKASLIAATAEGDRARLRAESDAAVTLTEARAEAERAQLAASAEAARVRALLEAGATAQYLEATAYAEAWKMIAAGENNLVVPLDAARFLGAQQIQRIGSDFVAVDRHE